MKQKYFPTYIPPRKLTPDQINALFEKNSSRIPHRRQFLSREHSEKLKSDIANRVDILFKPIDVHEYCIFTTNNQKKYYPFLTGIFEDGSNGVVILNNIDIFIDVRVDAPNLEKQLSIFLSDKNIKFTHTQQIALTPLKGFYPHPIPYKRIFFSNTEDRKFFINEIIKNKVPSTLPYYEVGTRDQNGQPIKETLKPAFEQVMINQFETANDDDEYFYTVAREYKFNTAGWNTISKYGIVNTNDYGFKSMVYRVDNILILDVANIRPYTGIIHPHLEKSKIIEMVIDIETYSYGAQTGEVPKAGDQYDIFMLSAVFSFYNEKESILKVCLVTVDCPETYAESAEYQKILGYDATKNAVVEEEVELEVDLETEENELETDPEEPTDQINTGLNEPEEPHVVTDTQAEKIRKLIDNSTDYRVIVCKQEGELIATYINLISKLQPNITLGFNSGNFDTVLIKDKIAQYGFETLLLNQTPLIRPIFGFNTPHAILNKLFKSKKVKISADETLNLAAMMAIPGAIDTDAMCVFKQIYPRSEVGRGQSLNFYLAMNNLAGKMDMPYKRMFRIYEESLELRNIDVNTVADETQFKNKIRNMTDMMEVAKYCVYDSYACHQLYLIRTVVDDKAELANLSYAPLCDSFYRANGIKVRNLIGATCWDEKKAFSNIKRPYEKQLQPNEMTKDQKAAKKLKEDNEYKYPGAWVVPPVRGVNKTDPTTGLDFSSLYPSLMMTYNFSPDKIIQTREEMLHYKALGYDIHEIMFEMITKKESTPTGKVILQWTIRHGNNFDGKATKFNPTWQVDANNNITRDDKKKRIPIYTRDILPGEQMGVFPKILKKLFDARAAVKVPFGALGKIKEIMEKCHSSNSKLVIPVDLLVNSGYAQSEKNYMLIENLVVQNDKNKKPYQEYIQSIIQSINYDDVVFKHAQLNCKQSAMKVHMNTFYGETGNQKSSVYMVAVAGGITQAGRYNIKLVYKYVQDEKQFKVFYGDTDSLYLAPPRSLFADISYPTKVEVFTEMVKRTRKSVNKLQDEVADMLALDNGTEFLKMAYEEVLFPVAFFGKKKYIGIKHEANENFYPKQEHIFIKGIDIIKQGACGFVKEVGWRVIQACLSIDDPRDLHQIILDEIKIIASTQVWDYKLFSRFNKYKPLKDNKTVNRFIARMVEHRKHLTSAADLKLYTLPDPGDRFETVLVEKEQQFTLRGCKIELKVADMMEFVPVYLHSQQTKQPMVINVRRYVSNFLSSLLARFLSYMPEFEPPQKTANFGENLYTTYDKQTIAAGVKYIMGRYNDLTGFVRTDIKEQGQAYQAVSRKVLKTVKTINKQLFDRQLITRIQNEFQLAQYPTVDVNVFYMKTLDMAKERADNITSKDYAPGTIQTLLRFGLTAIDIRDLYREKPIIQGARQEKSFVANRKDALYIKYNTYKENLYKTCAIFAEELHDVDIRIADLTYKIRDDDKLIEEGLTDIKEIILGINREIYEKFVAEFDLLVECKHMILNLENLIIESIYFYNKFMGITDIILPPKYRSPAEQTQHTFKSDDPVNPFGL